MSNYKIYITRDSVAAGDDYNAPHIKTITPQSEMTFQRLFEHLEQTVYLPNVHGTDDYWEALINGKKIAKFLNNSRKAQAAEALSHKCETYTETGRVTLHFQYFPAYKA